MDNEALKQVFQDLHPKIIQKVNPDPVMDELYSKNIISVEDCNDLSLILDSENRCRRFLLLLHRSSHSQTFIELRLALRENYPDIVNEVDKQMRSLTAQPQQLNPGHSTYTDEQAEQEVSIRKRIKMFEINATTSTASTTKSPLIVARKPVTTTSGGTAPVPTATCALSTASTISTVTAASTPTSTNTAVPGKPGVPQCEGTTANSITLSWKPPSNDGGTPIKVYVVEIRVYSTKIWTPAMTTDEDVSGNSVTIIKGLTEGEQYEIRVAAVNEVGRGEFAQTNDPVKTEPAPTVRVIKKITTDNDVHGVTSVDDKLFVLLDRDVDQVAVYSINKYQRLGRLSVPGLKSSSWNDMTSCVRHKCLYMSDHNNSFIHTYDLSSNVVGKRPVPSFPNGLSVTPNCNLLASSCSLLVVCGHPSKLIELRADSGEYLREITLPSDIEWPWHGVQLAPAGQFVVCHGLGDDKLHRVCKVDNDGNVKSTYVSDEGHLNSLCHFAVDKGRGLIYVADKYNDRVVLLNSKLQFVRYVVEKLSWPCRLYLQQARLFVGEQSSGRGVTVIQL